MSGILLKIGLLTFLVKLISGQAGFSGSGTSVPGVCVCATAGSCSLAGGGEANDGTGQLDARILNNGVTSAPTGSMDNTGLGIVGAGIGLVAWQQTTCDAAPGLERCCPTNGYTCGIRYPPVADAPRAQSGQAAYGAYPFQAAILTSSNTFLGAGVAIDHFHVLTAAHKLNASADAKLKVRMGDWDISGINEPIPSQEFMVLNITIHPQYNVGNLKNNIAILTLVSPIPLGQFPTMNNICLPNTTISNMRCMVAGWGKMDTASTSGFQNILKEVDLPLVPHEECQDMLRQNTRLGQNFNLDANCFICAGGEAGKDACTGDGGSPLSCFIYDRFYLVGLTAWGIGCGKENVPGVYVNIQTYIPWIQQFIAAENRMADRLVTTTRMPGNGTTTRRMGGGIITTTAPPSNSSSAASTVSTTSSAAASTSPVKGNVNATSAANLTSTVRPTTTNQGSTASPSIIFTTTMAIPGNSTANASNNTTVNPSSANATNSSSSNSTASAANNSSTSASNNSSSTNASTSSVSSNITTKAPTAGNITTSMATTLNPGNSTKESVANVGGVTTKAGSASNTTKANVAGVVTTQKVRADQNPTATSTTVRKSTVKRVKGARRA